MSDFVQTLITALAIGSLYALIALGYTMVYGILKFINFAHSDIVVLGAWSSYTLAIRILPWLALDPHNPATVPPVWVAVVVMLSAMLFCGVVHLQRSTFAKAEALFRAALVEFGEVRSNVAALSRPSHGVGEGKVCRLDSLRGIASFLPPLASAPDRGCGGAA